MLQNVKYKNIYEEHFFLFVLYSKILNETSDFDKSVY